MASDIDELYGAIGREAIGVVSGAVKILIYAEVLKGVTRASFFYLGADNIVRLRRCPISLQNKIYELWEAWKRVIGNHEWRSMAYAIDGSRFAMDLGYPDAIHGEFLERREGAVEKHFGSVVVDYSGRW